MPTIKRPGVPIYYETMGAEDGRAVPEPDLPARDFMATFAAQRSGTAAALAC